MARKAFTLVELLVVLGIIAILMAALSTSVSGAQRRARIAKAKAQANEITNAIRAYANMVDTGLEEMEEREATESAMAFILGQGGTDRAGNEIPVLYNASITGGAIRDPWGRPYHVTVKALDATAQGDSVATGMAEGIFIPNRYGRRARLAAESGGGQQ